MKKIFFIIFAVILCSCKNTPKQEVSETTQLSKLEPLEKHRSDVPLDYIDLSNENLTQIPYLGDYTIKSLDLSHNKIEKLVFPFLPKGLKTLNISYNSLKMIYMADNMKYPTDEINVSHNQQYFLFSTDLKLLWEEILEIYRQRFQIEFLYRDAKQFTGLNHCEAKSKSKLNFHWNASLTAVNLAKIKHWLPLKHKYPDSDIVFSMNDVKMQYYNELLLQRFISMFGINPKLEKNKIKIKQLLDFGKIAA